MLILGYHFMHYSKCIFVCLHIHIASIFLVFVIAINFCLQYLEILKLIKHTNNMLRVFYFVYKENEVSTHVLNIQIYLLAKMLFHFMPCLFCNVFNIKRMHYCVYWLEYIAISKQIYCILKSTSFLFTVF